MVQKRPVRFERRLAAILAADVAGYSRLMHLNEEATHAKLTTLLTEIVNPAIAEHNGRIVKNTGDGFLAVFPSAVQAIRAAVQFQTRIRKLADDDAEDQRVALRVGVNIGDVIVEPHDVFGDAVNVAARLEGIAEPGGICVSSSAYDQIRGKVSMGFVDLGETSLKNIAAPVRIYAVQDGLIPTVREAETMPGISSAPHLSIAVLPFANIGGNAEQEYFVDGVTDSLTTDLSRINGSFVIARSTAFTFKGKAVDVKQVGRELNVRYLLEGSVQKSRNRFRVNVQLIDVENGNHLWADRFDKPVDDLFEMQDEIVARIANTLDAQLVAAEARRASRSQHPDAMDLYFQGIDRLFRGVTPEFAAQARNFFERALAIDSDNIEARVGIAQVEVAFGLNYFTGNRTAHFLAAEAAVTKVLSLAPNHPNAHLLLGIVKMSKNNAALGIVECERALALDRNLATPHAAIGWAKYLLGRSKETAGHIYEALRLSPRDTWAFQWMNIAGLAQVQLGVEEIAVNWFRRSIEANRNQPMPHLLLAATLARLGELNEARANAEVGLALNPAFTVHRFNDPLSDNPTFLAGTKRICDGMRAAGIPER
jgi:TolB-like protein/class 3 adenylate cyclase/Tfp pilus assembly protein PilF